MDDYEHIFDEKTILYGSELGVWYGKCKNCELELSLYTGTSSLKPRGVRRYDITRSMSDCAHKDSKILMWDFDTFMEGYPNIIVLYSKCSRKEMT
jgi:hypothetical protein